MGIPFGVGLAIHLGGGPLANAGFLYYLLVFYPVTLAAETGLSLPSTRPPTSRPVPVPPATIPPNDGS